MQNQSASAHVQHAPPAGHAGHAAWTNLPATGPLAPAVAQALPHARLSAPTVTGQVAGGTIGSVPDPLAWRVVRHMALGACAVMALLVALHGDGSMMMTASYGATALLCVVTFVVADRIRFLAAPEFAVRGSATSSYEPGELRAQGWTAAVAATPVGQLAPTGPCAQFHPGQGRLHPAAASVADQAAPAVAPQQLPMARVASPQLPPPPAFRVTVT